MTMEQPKDDFDFSDEPVSADEFAWLEELETKVTAAAPKKPAKRPRAKRKPVAAKKAKADEQTVTVEAVHKLDCEALRGSAMFQAVNGKKRIWACDGEYVFFRRPRDRNGQEARDAQGALHAAIIRHEKFLKNGDYKYVETQDDVEICKVNEQSTFFRKGVYLGEMTEGGVRMAVVLAACMQDWPLYVDCLEEFARRIKNKYHSALASQHWEDQLNYVQHLIQLRRGPTPEECGRGLQQVRRARGEASGRIITMPPRSIQVARSIQ